jgi:hypothetical protein
MKNLKKGFCLLIVVAIMLSYGGASALAYSANTLTSIYNQGFSGSSSSQGNSSVSFLSTVDYPDHTSTVALYGTDTTTESGSGSSNIYGSTSTPAPNSSGTYGSGSGDVSGSSSGTYGTGSGVVSGSGSGTYGSGSGNVSGSSSGTYGTGSGNVSGSSSGTYGTGSGDIYGSGSGDIYGSGDSGVYGVDNTEIINFEDAKFEAAVKDSLGITSESVTKGDLQNITDLDLSGYNLINVSDLTYFPLLTHLDLSNNKISDISVLSSLAELSTLKLNNNKITSLVPLKSLTNLDTVVANGNNIISVSPLQILSQLQVLNVSTNQIADISSLAKLKNLKTLNLSNNKISNIIPLNTLTKLETLMLKGNKITDYWPVASYYKNLNTKDFGLIIPLKVTVNGKAINLGSQPIIVNGNTLVPLTPVFQALGAKVEWNSKAKAVKVTKGKTVIEVKSDSSYATVKGKKVKMQVATKVIKGVTFIPVSLTSNLGAKVTWDGVTKTVKIKI